MTNEMIVYMGFGLLILAFILVLFRLLSKPNLSAGEQQAENERDKLRGKMIREPQEFVVGKKLPVPGIVIFGGFNKNAQISILSKNFNKYSTLTYDVKLGSEITIKGFTFVIKGLDSEENKLLLMLKNKGA